MLAITVIWLAGLIPGAAARNNITFDLTLDHMSPLIRYNYSRDPLWNTTFENSPYPPSGDMVGRGPSYHSFNWSTYNTSDSRTQPNLDVTYASTEVVLLGNATGSDYDPSVSASTRDAPLLEYLQTTQVPSGEGELMHVRVNNDTGRVPTTFDFNLTTAAQLVQVRGARVSYTLPSDMQSFADVPITHIPFVVNGSLNPSIEWIDTIYEDWIVYNRTINVDGVDTTVSEAQSTGEAGATAFRVPRGTAFLTINGTVGPMQASLDVATNPPFLGSSRNSGTLMADCWAEYIAGTTLAAVPLDPDIDYDVTLRVFVGGNSGLAVGVYAMTLYSAYDPRSNDTSGAEQLSRGTSSNGHLIGGVVGGVIGGILLALLAAYFCYWRPRSRRRREEEAELSSFNAGFVSFGRDTHNGVVQETDAGAAPPQYDDSWDHQNLPAPSSGSRSTPFLEGEKTALLSPSPKSPLESTAPSSPETPLEMKISLLFGQAAGSGRLDQPATPGAAKAQAVHTGLPEGAEAPLLPYEIPPRDAKSGARGLMPQSGQQVSRPLPRIPSPGP